MKQLSDDIFTRFKKYGGNGCPLHIVKDLAREEIKIAADAYISHGSEAVEFKKRSLDLDDYMTAYGAGLRK